MIVASKVLLKQAQKENFAIPHVNFIDNNSARVFTEIAEERQLPLILAFAQKHSNILTLEEAANIGKFYAERVSVPVVLHLDHGEDIDFIKRSIELGFSSVMIDASTESFEENIRLTKEVVKMAHLKNIDVEAELGHVGANDTSEAKEVADSIYTDPEDVLEFVDETNVDSLAISIGTSHGVYKTNKTPTINFERLKKIRTVSDIPLVLHGGSSSGDKNLSECAKNGITKINIYSDFLAGAYQEIQENKPADYISLKESADKGMSKVLNHYYDVFGTEKII